MVQRDTKILLALMGDAQSIPGLEPKLSPSFPTLFDPNSSVLHLYL